MTLIETLVVIALTAILLGLAVPSMRAFIERNRVAESVNQMVGSINFARAEAIKRGARVVMCRSENAESVTTAPSCVDMSGDSGWASGWIVFVEFGSNDEYTPGAGDVLLRVQGPLLSNGFIMQNTNRKIVFSADGLGRSGSMLSFTFKPPSEAQSQERIVCVSMQGRPRLIKDTLAESCE
ncbi:MAG: GspH/FimT family pseudopilin [Proteobacteria bacterium]|nr:GspH/FimT family pseudopilin [Pseudomonadota bacterium]